MKIEKRIELFTKQEKHYPKSWELCPRVEKCNINKCPLCGYYSKLENDKSDPAHKNKEKCIPKRIRKEIGEFYNLKNKGLTNKEFSAQKYLTKEKEEKLSKSHTSQSNSNYKSIKEGI